MTIIKLWDTGDTDPLDWDGGDVFCRDMQWRPMSAIHYRFDGRSRNCIVAYRPKADEYMIVPVQPTTEMILSCADIPWSMQDMWSRALGALRGDRPHPVNRYQYSEETCPGHASDPKRCVHCGIHIDSLRPLEDDER